MGQDTTGYSPTQPKNTERRPLLDRQPTFLSLRRDSFRVSDTGGYGSLLANAEQGRQDDAVEDDDTDDDTNPHQNQTPSRYQKLLAFLNSKQMRYVFKCSVAYFLASMVVYSPIRLLYGTSENKHLAATVAVYFHPARTLGSMGESLAFVFASLTYSSFVAAMSMLVSNWFVARNLHLIGYSIDLIVFCAFGLGSIAFMKQRVNKPAFNTACSVAAIFIVTTLVKEGNVQIGIVSFGRIALVFNLVGAGIFVSALVCLVLWPETAVSEVLKAISKSVQINSKILILLTDNFIECKNVHGTQYVKLKEEFNSCFKSIHKHLSDARYELYFQGKEAQLETLRDLAQSSYKMSLHLNGLGSSALTQWSLIEDEQNSFERPNVEVDNDILQAALRRYGSINSMHSVQDRPTRDALKRFGSINSIHKVLPPKSESCVELFKTFIKSLGPPMKNYISSIKVILNELPIETVNGSCKSNCLGDTVGATDLYSAAREEAIATLYKEQNFKKERDFHSAANEEGAAASCGNFSYLLEEFGYELIEFQHILARYQQVSQSTPRSFNWLKFWETQSPLNNSSKTTPMTSLLNKSLKARSRQSNKVTWSLRLWRSLYLLRRPDVQFGIKVGLGATIFALPAFSESLRPIFTQWRGEWGITIYIIIMNKSVGGTTNTVKIRILGTILGAILAYIAWKGFPENKYVLPVCGWLLSLPSFWFILHWKKHNMFGRFLLLTFNLTLLYTYSLSKMDRTDGDEDDDETRLIIEDIAFHRVVSVCAGVIWALLITVMVLPNSARSRLKRGLSILWLQMGLVWKNDVLAKAENERRIAGVQGENLMQLAMIELNELLVNAPNEMRLKGPFPTKEYTALLKSTQNILDAFQDISVLVAKDRKATSREISIIEYTNDERAELCNRIFLNFYLLSSAMRLGFPLPDKMPSTEHAIDRMLAKLNDFRLSTLSELDETEGTREDYGHEEDFVLFYSYVLVTVSITEQLAKMALHIQNLSGVIEDDMFLV